MVSSQRSKEKNKLGEAVRENEVQVFLISCHGERERGFFNGREWGEGVRV